MSLVAGTVFAPDPAAELTAVNQAMELQHEEEVDDVENLTSANY